MTDTAAPKARRPGRPRDARADRTILEATFALLCEQGFSGVTVEAVAARAGVGKATIYRRWATRDRLLLEAASAVCSPLPPLDSGDLRQDLRLVGRAIADVLLRSPAGAALPAVVAEAARNADLRELLHRFVAERRAVALAAVERARDRGELRPDIDPGLVVDMFAGPLFYRVLLTGAPVDEPVVDQIVDLALDGARPTRRRR